MSGPYESCPFEVTRQHELDACGKPATTMIRHNWEGEWFVDAACTYHAHRIGGSIPLTEQEVTVRREQEREAVEMLNLQRTWEDQ